MIRKIQHKTLTLKDYYKQYLKENPKGSKNYLTKKQYRDINELYFQVMYVYLIKTGNPIKFNFSLGELHIRKRRAEEEQKKVDFKKTKEYGKVIYHENNHSNGYYARFKWNKARVYLRHKYVFNFTACRWATRLLAESIFQNNTIVKYYG